MNQRTHEILSGIQGKRIAVVGDVMLDRYFWGAVHRISPEAPVPVIDIERETAHLGGASNVAANIQSLGAVPLMLGIVGKDADGERLMGLLGEAKMSVSGIIADASRPTTVKTRIMGNNQHIARLDREVKTPIAENVANALLEALKRDVASLTGVILEDYNKGVITPFLIREIIALARQYSVPVFVDPKFANFFAYQGVTLFKPNTKETHDALGFALSSEEDVQKAGKILLEKLNCENVLITLGARGMQLFERNGNIHTVRTQARHIADVSGAGDTAIATLAAAYSAGASIVESAFLANAAAGAVCEEPGIVAITPSRLLAATQE
jgi:D-glycero-beta-D-manno-heptose-7-phosphate kinase